MTDCQTTRGRRASEGRWSKRIMLILAAWAVAGASCQKQPAAEPVADATANTATAPASYLPPMMDDQDDPAAPRALPRSNEVQGWIKTAPIKVAAGQRIPVLVADQQMDSVLSGYRIEQVATCEYTSANATARALLVEAGSPEDAFGVFGMIEPHPGCSPQIDNSLRGVHRDGKTLVLTAWQGHTWVRFICTLSNEEAGTKDCERLLSRTLFAVVADEPPILVRAVQDVKMEHCDLWLVRSATMLTKLDQPTLRRIDSVAVNERLGLSRDTTLSVVTIQQAADSVPLVFWLAEYPTADAAKAAADRYGQALKALAGGLDGQTLVGPVKGRIVVGTWSADQEAGRNLVKMLGQALPD